MCCLFSVLRPCFGAWWRRWGLVLSGMIGIGHSHRYLGTCGTTLRWRLGTWGRRCFDLWGMGWFCSTGTWPSVTGIICCWGTTGMWDTGMMGTVDGTKIFSSGSKDGLCFNTNGFCWDKSSTLGRRIGPRRSGLAETWCDWISFWPKPNFTSDSSFTVRRGEILTKSPALPVELDMNPFPFSMGGKALGSLMIIAET